MPFHDELNFDDLHKGITAGGIEASRPATPDGFGDLYWAPDANSGAGSLFLTNIDGTAWVEFNPLNGTITVNLGDLQDVSASSPTSGQALIWNGSAGEWQPQDNPRNLSEMLDVSVVGISDGETLTYDTGTQTWAPQLVPVIANQLADIDVQRPADRGTILVADGLFLTGFPVGNDGQVIHARDDLGYGVTWADPFTADKILVDSNFDILVDADGNVLADAYGI